MTNSSNEDKRNNFLKTAGILLGGILGGMLLLVIVGALPTLLKNVPSLFKDMVPNFKVVLGYIYVGIIAFMAGRFSKK